ncbi:hypothetical protein HUN01_29880 [Nostoc edaphicum CCNP1411]|uniref:Uncharacterized protein n=1 Tax=Nostoc edaphicum CCNP1411 TaxID=1472755 RepID=A0A7D7QQV5_9NOSO|nr:hypothetical protein [Nostoc edaphicum]QMS91605.1 hypothetical protein HUN01_29880 [Nostoc edaphicum CCNP1411]
MLELKNKLFKITIPFLSFYIFSVVSIITGGYIVKIHREIEEYKQIGLWYENLDIGTQYTNNISNFVKDVKDKLKENAQDFKNPESKKLSQGIEKQISFDQNFPNEGSVKWKIGKTKEAVRVHYAYTALNDFNGGQQSSESREKQKEESVNDKVFLYFTQTMISEIKKYLDNMVTANEVQNSHTFTKVVMNYLTGKDNYSNIIPDLRINNVYITNTATGFMLSYPFTDDKYKPNIILRDRPWHKAANNTYYSSYKETDGTLGLTGIYIDINDEKNSNAIRTLWYKFKTNDEKEYILCVDLFFDKSSNLSKEINLLDLDLLEQSIRSGINLKEGDNSWMYLLGINFIMALLLTLIYEFKVKDIILRISKRYPNDLVKIKLQLDRKHYASKDEGEIKFTIQGETKEINKSEQSMEAKWFLNIQNIQVGVNNNQSHTKQEEATSRYEFINEYDLNMSQSKPEMLNADTKLYIDSYTNSKKAKLVNITSSPQTNEHS